MVPPGRKFRVTWESAIQALSDDYPHPQSYRATVTYRDNDGHAYGPESYILDFNTYRGQAIGRKGLPELVRAVEDLKKEHAKWTDGIRGLRVNSVDRDKSARRRVRPVHFRRMREAWKDGGIRAVVAYYLDIIRNRYGLWSR